MNVYGIETCATVRKARAWLVQAGIAFTFVDLRKHPLTSALLGRWVDRWGWERVLNRRGTTWRMLPASDQVRVSDAASAMALMQRHPTLIKRPVLEAEGLALLGFDEATYEAAFEAQRDRTAQSAAAGRPAAKPARGTPRRRGQ